MSLHPVPELALNLNESPWGPSPLVLEALRQALPTVGRYAEPAQVQALQEQIARAEGLDPEQVLLGDLFAPLARWLFAGETARTDGAGELLYSDPGYLALVEAAAPWGGRPRPVPLDAHLGHDLQALARAAGPATRALYLVNPHNPSGTLSPAAALDAFLREQAPRQPVIVDEAYIDYLPEPRDCSAVRLLRQGLPLLIYRTFDKLHGLAGLSLDVLLAPLPIARALRAQGVGQALGLNRLALVAASASLQDAAHRAQVRDRVAEERQRWHDWLDRRRLQRSESVANFVFFDAGHPHAELSAALQARGIRVGRRFDPLDGWLRMSIGPARDNERVREALAALLPA